MNVYWKTGLTGNLYIWCKHKVVLEAICKGIGKSPKSIYWNDKFTNVVRIKNKSHKQKARDLLNQYYTKKVPSNIDIDYPPKTSDEVSAASLTMQRYEKK